jgi:hypothetical protein
MLLAGGRLEGGTRGRLHRHKVNESLGAPGPQSCCQRIRALPRESLEVFVACQQPGVVVGAALDRGQTVNNYDNTDPILCHPATNASEDPSTCTITTV